MEDPKDELTRRIAAVAMHYGIHVDEMEGKLFVDSGREQGVCLGQQTKDGTEIIEPVAEALEAELKARQIDVLIIDPFVSSHQVSENDNGAVDAVVKRWGSIADRTGCAIEIVHHLRKSNGMEANAESARGAVSLAAAARSVRVLNRMSDSEAGYAGLESPKGFFKVFDDKNNLAPAADRSDWFKIVPVSLPNGDGVGVVTRWFWPDPFADVTVSDLVAVQRAVYRKNYRSNSQAENWVGNASEAARRAGYSAATAKEQGRQLLAKPHVAEAIDKANRAQFSGTRAAKATALLERIVDDENAPMRVRLDAAKTILDCGGITAGKPGETPGLNRKPLETMDPGELEAFIRNSEVLMNAAR